jgi:hypothetical protein
VTGTPYVGADQFAEACGGNGAAPGEADFPRMLDGVAPWQGFSVTSPARQMADAPQAQSGNARLAGNARSDSVTGTAYESSRHITGPFGMASGKITGTEQARFDSRRSSNPALARSMGQSMAQIMKPTPAASPTAPHDPVVAETEQAPAQTSRITGEGQTAGSKVTGDDWERGDRVTGTEGASARRRNPTRPGPMGAMPPLDMKRNDEIPKPVSRVTGGGGSSERGSLVTYSGGARG